MHVTQFGNGDEIVEHGRAPTVSAVDPILSGQEQPSNSYEFNRYLRTKVFELQASPKTSPAVKLLAGVANEVVDPGPLTIASYAVPLLRAVRLEALIAKQAPLLQGAELLSVENSSATFLFGAKQAERAVVIGEGMGAVKTTTRSLRGQGINVRWWQSWGKNWPKDRLMTPTEMDAALARNRRWIEAKIKDGYTIFDIGLDPKRLGPPSPFYRLEKEILLKHNYPTIPLLRP